MSLVRRSASFANNSELHILKLMSEKQDKEAKEREEKQTQEEEESEQKHARNSQINFLKIGMQKLLTSIYRAAIHIDAIQAEKAARQSALEKKSIEKQSIIIEFFKQTLTYIMPFYNNPAPKDEKAKISETIVNNPADDIEKIANTVMTLENLLAARPLAREAFTLISDKEKELLISILDRHYPAFRNKTSKAYPVVLHQQLNIKNNHQEFKADPMIDLPNFDKTIKKSLRDYDLSEFADSNKPIISKLPPQEEGSPKVVKKPSFDDNTFSSHRTILIRKLSGEKDNKEIESPPIVSEQLKRSFI